MLEKSTIIAGLRSGLMGGSAIAMIVFCYYLFAPGNSNIDPITTATVHEAPTENTPDLTIGSKDTQPEISPADQALNDALDALEQGNMRTVIAARDEMSKDNPDRHLLTWFIATSGHRDVAIEELRSAQGELDGWPGLEKIARNLESAMARDPVAIMRLRIGLDSNETSSFQLAFALARTYIFTRNFEKARALIIPYWHDKVLSATQENRVLGTLGDALTMQDHQIRFFTMMSRNRIRSGGRIAAQIGAEALHEAWAAVIRRQNTANSLMQKLSEKDKETAAYAFMHTEFLRRSDKDDDAIALLKKVPTNAEYLVNPDAWWDERRIISRHKFEAGEFQSAYDLVAAHQGGSDTIQVDAAFHAGWYALRGLKDAALAVAHFEKITQIAKGDISRARGYYWLGRALQTPHEATDAFEKAAQFATTYYGQLALEELKVDLSSRLMDGQEVLPEDQSHAASLRAAKRLDALGHDAHARTLYLSMGWSWQDASAIALAAKQALLAGDHFAALKIAKAANWRGMDMGNLTHPLGAISDATGIEPVDHALAYAIARQESEFNNAAISTANAMGLMQVLPGTAREMAKKSGITYEAAKLTSDANYNARLGVAYLNEQLDKFHGSYVLTFAAYNAGPARAREWIERFGDPRGKSLYEVIDWIEMIPFPETRSYVQRIMENLQIYKIRLGQKSAIDRDIRFGTARPF